MNLTTNRVLPLALGAVPVVIVLVLAGMIMFLLNPAVHDALVRSGPTGVSSVQTTGPRSSSVTGAGSATQNPSSAPWTGSISEHNTPSGTQSSTTWTSGPLQSGYASTTNSYVTTTSHQSTIVSSTTSRNASTVTSTYQTSETTTSTQICLPIIGCL